MSYAGQLLLVVLPAVIGAFGTVVSIVVAKRLEVVRRQTNGRLRRVERAAGLHVAHDAAEGHDSGPAATQPLE